MENFLISPDFPLQAGDQEAVERLMRREHETPVPEACRSRRIPWKPWGKSGIFDDFHDILWREFEIKHAAYHFS